jgi:hypothetical protein
MANPFALVRDSLALIHPDAPWVGLTLGIWLVQWALRRWAPGVWSVLFSWVPADMGKMSRSVAMGLPSVIVGAALPAMAAGVDWRAAAIGAGMGAIAPLWHHLLRAAPGPYQGALRRAGAPVEAPGSAAGPSSTAPTTPPHP